VDVGITLQWPESRKSLCPPRLSIASDQETKTPFNKRTTAGCSCSSTGGSVVKPLRHTSRVLSKKLVKSVSVNLQRRLKCVSVNLNLAFYIKKHDKAVRIIKIPFMSFWSLILVWLQQALEYPCENLVRNWERNEPKGS
jgi:hypothetical protein